MARFGAILYYLKCAERGHMATCQAVTVVRISVFFWALSIVQYSKKREKTTFWKLDFFRNVVFSRFLEYWMMDRVEKPSSAECHTPLLELSRF
jgi:hypothetical protein